MAAASGTFATIAVIPYFQSVFVALKPQKIINQIENLQKKKTTKQQLKPLSSKEYQKIIKDSEEDIKAGRLYAHEDVVKYIKRKR
jgi:hypothetical protein